MNSDEQRDKQKRHARAKWERVLTRMKQAGWLNEFGFTDDCQLKPLDWTTTGRGHAAHLQEIVREFEVKEANIDVALTFGVFDEPRIPVQFTQYWHELTSQLGHPKNRLDHEELNNLFHALVHWSCPL